MAQTWSDMTQNIVMSNSVLSHPSSRTHGGICGRTKWLYVTLPDGDTIIDPTMGFYRNPPPHAECRWSTDHGRKPATFFDPNHLQMPTRDLTKWDDAKLVKLQVELTEKYWEDMKTLVRPETFEDLYKYFDSATLWMNGAYNLWNLINMLVTEAHRRWPDVLHDWKNTIDIFVNDFLYVRPGFQYNQAVLLQWDGLQDPIELRFDRWFYDEINAGLDLLQQNMVREALICQYTYLTGTEPGVPQYFPCYPRPVVNIPSTAVTNTIEVASQPVAVAPANTAAEQLPIRSASSAPERFMPAASTATKPPVILHTSPPSAPLTRIPEEPATVKSGEMTNNVATEMNDTTAQTKATITEAQKPVPEIVTNIATTPRKSTHRDRKDSNGSTDKLFFNPQLPQPSSEHLTVKGRHLSISSAPNEESEPMLVGADATSQKRIASEAPPTLNSESAQQVTQSLAPGVHAAVKNGRQGPWRGSRKSPPSNGPTQQCPTFNTPMCRPTQSMLHQGPTMGPSPSRPSQQMMPTFGPPNAMAQPPPAFVPNPPNMQPGPTAGSMSHGPPPPQPGMGTCMPPVVPQMGAFQEQLPMAPPQMGQPPFDHAQGPPRNIPPPFMGSQYQGAPIYQPNGYIHRPEHHHHSNIHANGVKPNLGKDFGKRDNRRNSVQSNGSRKVRDDPIHGAIYALGQPRRTSNASSGHRSSIANKFKQDYGRGRSASFCNNSWTTQCQFNDLHEKTFHECPCSRCEEATRSVYIKARGVTTQSFPQRSILKHFAKFAPATVIPQKSSDCAVVFHNDVDAICAVQEACANPDKSIPGWAKQSSVWYPLFSKHFTSRATYTNPTGLPRHLIEAQNQACSSNMRNRADSNPFRHGNPRPSETYRGPNFGNGGPGSMQQGFQPPPNIGQMPPPNFMPGNCIPFQPMLPPPQRKLWEPSTSPHRKSTTSASFARSEQHRAPTSYQGNTVMRKEQILQKEDWRSKPPAEEALSDDVDDFAIADTASNYSSQGARSIKVFLPSEEGSAREAISRTSSRSVPSESDMKPQKPSQEQLQNKATTSEPRVTGAEELGMKRIPSSRTMSPETAKPGENGVPTTLEKTPPNGNQDTQPKNTVEDHSYQKVVDKNKPKTASPKESTSGYRKTATDLTEPVESFIEATTKSGYRKTTDQPSSATEKVMYSMETVIRHEMPPRSLLPTEWATEEPGSKVSSSPEEATDSSAVRGRFDDIGKEISHQETSVQEMTSVRANAPAAMSEATPDATQPPAESQQAQQIHQPKKQGKTKNKKWKAQGGPSHPTSRSNTPTDAQSRGPSPAFNHPPSANASTNAPSSRGPLPTFPNNNDHSAEGAGTLKKKKNNNRNKSKRKPTQPASEFSDGLAKSSGSQDNKDVGARQGSPLKRLRVMQPESVVKMDDLEVPKSVDVSQNKTEAKLNDSNRGNYRADNGGSLRLEKNRSSAKGGDTTALPIIFEPPTTEAKDVSPNANLFPHQKFAIDQVRKAGPPPKMSLDSTTQQEDSIKPTGINERAGNRPNSGNPFPQLSPNAKQPSGDWAAVVRGSFRNQTQDDPFAAGKGEETPKDWINLEGVKALPKAKANDGQLLEDKISPTPSPEKNSHRPSKSKSRLNAAAQLFTSSRGSSPGPMMRLNPAAREFTSSLPPSPALSVVSAGGHTGGSTSVSVKESVPPHNVTRSVLPIQSIAKLSNTSKGHSKKASLPGQPMGLDQRLVTPAEQIVDPSKVAQPGPPAKEKKTTGGGPRNGPVPDRTGGNPNSIPITKPRPIPANAHITEQPKDSLKTAAVVVADSAPAKMDGSFPTLGEAAAAGPTRKRRAASIVKAGMATVPAPGVPAGGKTTTTAPKIIAAGQNNAKAGQGQRNVTAPVSGTPTATTVTKSQQPRVEQKQSEEEKKTEDKDTWQTVGPTKKNAGGAARGHGGRGGRGGRMGHVHQGGRGGRVGSASTDERKGG